MKCISKYTILGWRYLFSDKAHATMCRTLDSVASSDGRKGENKGRKKHFAMVWHRVENISYNISKNLLALIGKSSTDPLTLEYLSYEYLLFQ